MTWYRMSDIAIRVGRLGKRYRIVRVEGYGTLRDALVSALPRMTRIPRNGKENSSNSCDTCPGAQFQGSLQNSGDLSALRDVSFEVKRGEVVGTLAPHGGCSAGVIGRHGAAYLRLDMFGAVRLIWCFSC